MQWICTTFSTHLLNRTYYLKTVFQVRITAPASDLDLFLIPYAENDSIDLEIEILDILQPYVGKHDENLKWLDYLIHREDDDI